MKGFFEFQEICLFQSNITLTLDSKAKRAAMQ